MSEEGLIEDLKKVAKSFSCFHPNRVQGICSVAAVRIEAYLEELDKLRVANKLLRKEHHKMASRK